MSVDTASSSDPLRRRLRRLTSGERLEEALAFLRMQHREAGLSEAAFRRRRSEVKESLAHRGTYEHTPQELAFGARVAWRNHARCIGRLFWPSLEVVDCRHVREPGAMMARVTEHMARSWNGGRVRSMISVFAPASADSLPPYIESTQLVQYAGYLDGGGVIGDPRNIEATRIATALGWNAPTSRGNFDILPVILRDERGRRLIFELPPSVIHEIDIVHPRYPGIAALGLRWYAIPYVSGMILSIGGIDYPCAPFNGFYMGTEIASRNLGDERRYNALPAVASALGEFAESSPALWKDRAATELNAAVLHSFAQQGVMIVDHHSASEQYMEFVRREHAAGRTASGDWTWIVPPQASSSCPVFHLSMQDLNALPNFYHSRATDGARLTPFHEHPRSGRLRQRLLRWRRRFRRWRKRYD